MTNVLRILLTVVTLFCVQSSLLSQVSEFKEIHERAWDDEQPAIERIKELGGWVKLEECLPDEISETLEAGKRKFVVEVNMVYNGEGAGRENNDNFSDECLAEIAKCSQVRRIMLTGDQINNEGLETISALEHVEQIFMWNATNVTDDGIKFLAGFKNLEKLHVGRSDVTADGIGYLLKLKKMKFLGLQNNWLSDDIFEHAANFPELEILAVGSPGWNGEHARKQKFSNDGLRHLARLEKLKILDVQNSDISDEGLVHLHDLKNLEAIWFTRSQITEEGIDSLREHLPKLKKRD